MAQLSPTQLEKLRGGCQGWNAILERNARLLNDTLLYVSGMLDVTLTSLSDDDILQWSDSLQKWVNVPRGSVIPTTTTTTTTTTTSTTSTVTTTTVTGTTTTSTTSTSTTTVTTTTTTTIYVPFAQYSMDRTSTTTTSTTTTTTTT